MAYRVWDGSYNGDGKVFETQEEAYAYADDIARSTGGYRRGN